MKVTLLGPDDAEWALGRQDSQLRYYCGAAGSHGREMIVDPYPAYVPDKALVEDLVAECHAMWPLDGDVGAELFIISHEFIARSNGLSYSDHTYYKPDGSRWESTLIASPFNNEMRKHSPITHTIVLCAKRIPIHPAMLRYLVAHEYGHCVFNRVRRLMGYLEHEDEKLAAAYMELRGFDGYVKKYNGGKWHLSPKEIIANDFRMLVPEREKEFWPHPVPSPWQVPKIIEWWDKARDLSRKGSAA